MNERELEEIAAKLGAEAAERLDVDRVAGRVVAELRAEPSTRAWWRRTAVVRAAATVTVLLTGGVLMSRVGGDRPTTVAALVAPVGLEEFSESELTEMLDSLDLMTPVYELVPASLDDLDESQLQELLQAMEG